MSYVGTHDDPKFSTVHTMSNVGTDDDPKFSTVHRMLVHTMIRTFPQYTECWYTR